AYGSSKDISVYQSLDMNPEQIYIVGRVSKKHQLVSHVGFYYKNRSTERIDCIFHSRCSVMATWPIWTVCRIRTMAVFLRSTHEWSCRRVHSLDCETNQTARLQPNERFPILSRPRTTTAETRLPPPARNRLQT